MAILCVRTEKNSTGCHWDNIDAKGSAHSPFESLCPKYFKTQVKTLKLSVLAVSEVSLSGNVVAKIGDF